MLHSQEVQELLLEPGKWRLRSRVTVLLQRCLSAKWTMSSTFHAHKESNVCTGPNPLCPAQK